MGPSASESELLARSPPEGPPALEPHPWPASCFGTQHCPPVSTPFEPEIPGESVSELTGCRNGKLDPLTNSNVSPSSLRPPALCGHKTEVDTEWGLQISPDLAWEPPGEILPFSFCWAQAGPSEFSLRGLMGSVPQG